MLTVWANQDQQYYYNVIKAVAESSRFDLLHLTLHVGGRSVQQNLLVFPSCRPSAVCMQHLVDIPRHRRHQIPVGLLLLHELIAFAIAAPFWSFWSFHPPLPPAEHLWSVPSGLLERDGYRWRSGCLGGPPLLLGCSEGTERGGACLNAWTHCFNQFYSLVDVVFLNSIRPIWFLFSLLGDHLMYQRQNVPELH